MMKIAKYRTQMRQLKTFPTYQFVHRRSLSNTFVFSTEVSHSLLLLASTMSSSLAF